MKNCHCGSGEALTCPANSDWSESRRHPGSWTRQLHQLEEGQHLVSVEVGAGATASAAKACQPQDSPVGHLELLDVDR